MLSHVPLAHIQPEVQLYAALYKDLQNAQYLRDQLLAGNPDLEYAFIDARMILSTAHILAAVFRAINDAAQGRLKTRNVHAEIVFAMNPNNNIAEAFRKFGISNDTKNLLVIKVCSDSVEAVAKHLASCVEATSLEFNNHNLEDLSNMKDIRKVYKLTEVPSKGKGSTKGDRPAEQHVAIDKQEIEMSVLGTIALRGAN